MVSSSYELVGWEFVFIFDFIYGFSSINVFLVSLILVVSLEGIIFSFGAYSIFWGANPIIVDGSLVLFDINLDTGFISGLTYFLTYEAELSPWVLSTADIFEVSTTGFLTNDKGFTEDYVWVSITVSYFLGYIFESF